MGQLEIDIANYIMDLRSRVDSIDKFIKLNEKLPTMQETVLSLLNIKETLEETIESLSRIITNYEMRGVNR